MPCNSLCDNRHVLQAVLASVWDLVLLPSLLYWGCASLLESNCFVSCINPASGAEQDWSEPLLGILNFSCGETVRGCASPASLHVT